MCACLSKILEDILDRRMLRRVKLAKIIFGCEDGRKTELAQDRALCQSLELVVLNLFSSSSVN
jgi:hypothetical protein